VRHDDDAGDEPPGHHRGDHPGDHRAADDSSDDHHVEYTSRLDDVVVRSHHHVDHGLPPLTRRRLAPPAAVECRCHRGR
jgi:hypothetical protein